MGTPSLFISLMKDQCD